MLIATQIALLALLAVAYARRTKTLLGEAGNAEGPQGEAPSRSQIACFAAGVLLVAGAAASLSHLSGRLLYARTIQLLLIGDIGPLLLVLGLTPAILSPLFSHRSSRPLTLLPRLLTLLLQPFVALPLWALLTMLCWWPGPVDLAQHSEPLSLLLDVLCFAAGVLAWGALLRSQTRPSRFPSAAFVAYVLLWRTFAAALGAVGVWVPWVFYDRYTSIEVARAVSPLADQGISGAILIGEAALAAIGALLWLYLKAGVKAELAEGSLIEPVAASANAASNSS